MSCASFLRRVGILEPRPATDDEVVNALTENAQRDNAAAFEEMHTAYSKVPDIQNKLQETIKRSTPFADLENMMHGTQRRARS